MKFMNTTKALGTSLLALGMIGGFAQGAAAVVLDGYYKVTGPCAVTLSTGKIIGTNPVQYAHFQEGAEVVNAANTKELFAEIIEPGRKYKILYDGTITRTTGIDNDGGSFTIYSGDLEACSATKEGYKVAYKEDDLLFKSSNPNLLPSNNGTSMSSITFPQSEAITRECFYVFEKLEGEAAAKAAMLFKEDVPQCIKW